MINYQKNITKFRKVKNIIIKEFDSEPVYNEKYLEAKLKSLIGKSAQLFRITKYQKKVLNLSVILVDSVFRTAQITIFKCFQKNVDTLEKKIPKYIIGDIEIPSDSDEENSQEEILIKKIQMIKNSDDEERSDDEILI